MTPASLFFNMATRKFKTMYMRLTLCILDSAAYREK